MARPPAGEVTFLFTDIVGSTALWDQHPRAMSTALAEHDTRIRGIVESADGYVFTTAGDSFAVAFATAAPAVHSAVAIQLAMREPAGGLDLAVRIGLHTGTTEVRNGDYFGGTVNRSARIASSAHAHQIVMSQSTLDSLDIELDAEIGLVDLGIHRLRGLAEPAHLYQICHRDLPREHPRLRTVEGPDDALPVQLTSFVGRSRELTEVAALVRTNRHLTLSGSGGAGKTRLAVRVAEHLIADFPDGLRMAELGAVHDGEVLVEEIAQRFAVTAVGGDPLAATLGETIGAQRMLLVLDNCEQIVGPVAEFCRDILARCPQLHVLATSRHRLGVEGEVVYRVPSLVVPDDGVGPDDAMAYDAVRLFVDRARLADPQFEVTAHNVTDIVSICRHLDGIPLALELAAARVRSMSPAQVLQRLDRRFKLLTGADRTSIPRQETLLSTIEWSHELLDDAERRLFRRLGVFAADFPLEAAEGTCTDANLDELDVLDLLAALVDKSMVATEQGTDDAVRYNLLESIREFAGRCLDAASETESLRRRHAEHFADRAEALQAMQRAGELAEALLILEADDAEFRSALRFATDSGHHVLAGRLIGGLGYLWYAAGRFREGYDWCRTLLDRTPDLPDAVRADVLHSFALAVSGDGRPDLGIEAGTEQVTIRRRLGDPARLAGALVNLGNYLVDVGEVGSSGPVLEEAAEIYADLDEPASLSLVYCTMGYGHMIEGNYQAAEATFREALRNARAGNRPMSVAVSMSGIGQALTYARRGTDARPHLVESRERYDELNVPPGVITSDAMLGLVARDDGDLTTAARRWLMALTNPGRPWYDEDDYSTLQYVASILDDPRTAAVLLGATTAAYEATRVQQIAYVLSDLAATRARRESELGDDEFGERFRAGGRRTKDEVMAIATAALEESLAGDEAAPGARD